LKRAFQLKGATSSFVSAAVDPVTMRYSPARPGNAYHESNE
jgi:hypothetical protein